MVRSMIREGVRSIASERRKNQLGSWQEWKMWNDQELQMVQNLKRMIFEMNAFACTIIIGDSSLSGVEQF